jgi:hypothetical protein
MFTSTREEHRTRRYCADCADTNKEVRAELAAAHATRDLDVSSDQEEIEGQICEGCQRPISQVPAHLGLYRVQAQVTFTVEVDVQARSATDAEFQVDAGVNGANFALIMRDLGVRIKGELDDPDKVSVDECEYFVGPGKSVPPEQEVFVSPSQERMRFSL